MVCEVQKAFLEGDQDGNVTQAIDALESLADSGSAQTQPGQQIGPFGIFPVDVPGRLGHTDDEILETPDSQALSPALDEGGPSPGALQRRIFDVDSADTGVIEETAVPWLDGSQDIILPWVDATNEGMGQTATSHHLSSDHLGISSYARAFVPTNQGFAMPDLQNTALTMNAVLAPFYSSGASSAARLGDQNGQRVDGMLWTTSDQSHWSGQSTIGMIVYISSVWRTSKLTEVIVEIEFPSHCRIWKTSPKSLLKPASCSSITRLRW
jgi:hypothetical protein